MIVFSALVSHTPLLAKSIGKERRDALAATLKSFQALEEELYLARPETIVIMSPHAQSYPDAFSANIAPKYVGNLKTFGDHETLFEAKGDFLVIDHLQRGLRHKYNIPFTLTSAEDIDYGMTIPLLLLTEKLKDWKLIPLAPSRLDAQAHVEFGKALRQILNMESKRIAFLVSTDLSHKLNEQSPGGSSVEGPAFDATVRTKMQSLDVEGMLALDPQALEAAGQNAYLPLMTLLGFLSELNVTPRELSYEAPFGVGCLMMKFEMA
ncbi:MEMO1 family protein [Patescibacteria group bacterium]|uniref:MEMO1 family protein n=1 Tax=candidate division WWE3 bacterium TaxID=2053526 RepID=A0A928TRA0_UNCKA|nr:MEMO1 family protein [candidate division WWE3 bacterium]MCL4732507.1 MEMO1 family protein [Patescibacteria group bacterium]MDL1952585.1 hypothetical protein [Candidatus Uhrbacteria bacterium UHB]RIL01282.1 MAG: hypothetical protein DCC77_01950 [Candidatus Uhrbacteria bacterium]